MAANIDLYEHQHDQALKFAGEIVQYLITKESARSHAVAIRLSLAKLAGALKAHLRSEDTFLYPELMNSSDPRVAETAQRFWNEMGGLAPVITEFFDKWKNAGKIESETDDFLKECKMIFEALASRIDAEETELYPLVKKAA